MNFHRVPSTNAAHPEPAYGGREPSWSPLIAVPARNEAQRLPLLMRALSKQTWLKAVGRRLHVTIVLNNCEDDSIDVVKREALLHPSVFFNLISVEFPEHLAHVGSARRLAAETALAATTHDRFVLMTTDADGVPEPGWVENNLRAIEAGADAVGGFILADEAEVAQLGAKVRRRAALHLYYARLADKLTAMLEPLDYDPWPRHQDHTGASLAVRAEVYRGVGGIPALAFREDVAFVERIRAAGFRLRHALDVRVRVSARLDGRAENGMSDCLNRWIKAEMNGQPHLVEPPQAILEKLLQRRRHRFRRVSNCCGAYADRTMASHCFSSGGGSDPSDRDPVPTLPIETAIVQIQRIIANVGQFKAP
jgi:Glycosyl transferase family 2